MAGIVVQADSQSELNHILLTLGAALGSYGTAKQPHYHEEKTWK
ncbi:MAG TPA: hypothetical protein VLJ11_01155 [Bryobacteraceae bacterium]|nr:hypothetical protein [Bryobacteraceae bacterium]